MTATITREELQAKLKRGDDFALVETLPEESYRQMHLPAAINLPPDRMMEMAGKILPDKSAEIVVYCAKPT